VRQPLRFDGDAGVVRRRAPGLGEHTREVLAEIGMSNSDIDAYIASGGVVPDNVRT
jgi:crotonobetainyl-CoA:carnitine CoA-transferase CaiB-like acyl-CoA transferase